MKKNLDIVIVTDTYPPEVNGVALSIVRVVRHLRSARHRVRLVRPRQQDEAANEGDLLVRGLPLPRYPGLRFGLPAWRRLLRAWREERPDVVHIVTEGPLGWSALLAARQLGVPVTSDYRTHFDAYSSHYGLGMLSAAVRAVLRAFHNRTDLTFVPTAALEMQMKRQGYRRLVRVGRGVDTRLFNPQRRSLELRTSWGVKPHDPVFLYVGRLARKRTWNWCAPPSTPSAVSNRMRASCGWATVRRDDAWTTGDRVKFLPVCCTEVNLRRTTRRLTSSSSPASAKPSATCCWRRWPADWPSSPSIWPPRAST